MRAVITGASDGIGEALARHYARQDSTLALIARRKDALDTLAAELPGRTVAYPLDVSDEQALARAARDFIDRFGAPDLVIANAGVSAGTHGDELSDIAKTRRLFQVNLIGLAATLAAFAPAMRAAGRGTLCGISSVSGFRGLAGAGAYCASKSAVITWLESLRAELHGSGISVVTVCPGYVQTPMTRANPYRMPFLLPADEAARGIARAIEGRRRLAVIPWQMALLSYALRALPGWLYDRIAARAPRKPRGVKV